MVQKKSFSGLIKVLLVCLLVIFPVFTILADSGLVENVGKGQIDWEKGTIRVSGFGVMPQNKPIAQAKLLARKAAETDAQRNAVAVISGVRVNSETTVENFETTSDIIRTAVQGFIQGGEIVGVNFSPDGICEIILEIPLSGRNDFTRMVHKQVVEKNPPAPVLPTPVIDPATPDYTGIIIDARKLGIKPALYPQIFDSTGKLLYGPTTANPDQLSSTTMIAYSRSMERAQKMERIGKNPLVLTATTVIKSQKGDITDVVINSDSAKQFTQAAVKNNLLVKAAVVLIID
jgi:hypothetical protein